MTCSKWRPRTVGLVFGKLQLVSAGYMGFSHGSNDAQKTMGIITLALFTGTSTGAFANLPEWAHFLRVQEFKDIPFWVVITCAITMAAGTAAGFTGFFGYVFGSAIAGAGVGWIADHWGWGGVFATMIVCCVLTIAFSAMTLGHRASSSSTP